MKINLKARLKNKVFLLAFCALLVGFVYQTAALFGITPPIAEDNVTEFVGIIINILAFLGVVTDPTTAGLSDSARALTYDTDNDVRYSIDNINACDDVGGDEL